MTIDDIQLAGSFPIDPAIARLERDLDHRVGARRFILDHIPDESIGAELGVYTGLFSSLLAREKKISSITFVDPWWLKFGEFYPGEWGVYSDFGRISTRNAHRQAVARITNSDLPGRSIEIDYSETWLNSLSNGSLDWAYIDCSLIKEELEQNLVLLDRKLRPDGLIIGDDWWCDGVFLAVNDFLKTHDFDLLFADGVRMSHQWMLRRAYPDRHPHKENMLRADVGLAMSRKPPHKRL